jgi:hypothetical protein
MYFSWTNFIIGLMGVVGGVAITINAYHINHHIWYFTWAERHLGGGMGTIAYRWIGVAISIFSALVMIGQINISGQTVSLGGPTNSTTAGQNRSIPNPGSVQIAP